jgi:hypothetical protein
MKGKMKMANKNGKKLPAFLAKGADKKGRAMGRKGADARGRAMKGY